MRGATRVLTVVLRPRNPTMAMYLHRARMREIVTMTEADLSLAVATNVSLSSLSRSAAPSLRLLDMGPRPQVTLTEVPRMHLHRVATSVPLVNLCARSTPVLAPVLVPAPFPVLRYMSASGICALRLRLSCPAAHRTCCPRRET